MSVLFNIPESCNVGNTIFKKQFYDNSDLSTADKNLFTNSIDKILWRYCLKSDTINIRQYKDDVRDYPEIEVLEVILQKETKLKRIAEIIMRAIPYPMLLVFTLDNKTQLWTAHQRTNQGDNTKNTLEEFVNTGWMEMSVECGVWSVELFDITKMNLANFYTLYSDIVDAISIHNINSKLHTPNSKLLTGAQARELTAKIEELDKQVATLKSKAKKETQFNKKVEMKLKIKKLEQMKKEILGV